MSSASAIGSGASTAGGCSSSAPSRAAASSAGSTSTARYAGWEYVGQRPRRVDPSAQATINPEDAQIRQDILRMIVQYLQDEGYTASSTTIQDETNVKLLEQFSQRSQVKRMRRAILEGDWVEVEKLSAKAGFANAKSFLYAAYREQYLELIEGQEYQKAFTHLTKRLKPLESFAASAADFKDLCYLLTCKSVQEVLREWEGIASAREQLAEQYCSMREFGDERADVDLSGAQPVPPRRLLRLLDQAVAYQIEFSHYHPSSRNMQASTLLDDYACALLPNARRGVLCGHAGAVKSVQWVGRVGLLASGGNDQSVRLWHARSHAAVATLRGHHSRVWHVAAAASGRQIASASADGTVKLWALGELAEAAPPADAPPVGEVKAAATLSAHSGDVYSVQFHPAHDAQLVSGGYDKTVRLYDLAKGALLRTLYGHTLSVAHTVYNSVGNLVVSAAKDATIRFWDLRSAVCLQAFGTASGQQLGELTSVQLSPSGLQLLSSSRDNAVRLWDVRSAKPLRCFKGHQNTSKSFVRARFGPGKGLVVSGSEDGAVCLWDLESGQLMQQLRGHADVAYDAVWSEELCTLASCSHDGTLATWWYDASQPLFCEDPHADGW